MVALPAPTEREKSQWYFQTLRGPPSCRRNGHLRPVWYNRAGIERVMGFCTESEYQEFLRSCPEDLNAHAGTIGHQLIKYWFSVSDDEQERRFQKRLIEPTKRWKLSPMDLESQDRWVDCFKAKDECSSIPISSRHRNVVNSDIKKHARLNCISHLLSVVPYTDCTPGPDRHGRGPRGATMSRPPVEPQKFVPEIY
ncbi:MAG: polyphosphate kinase 2 [Rhodobacter sp.]|nr:polyphosphate kinase 2 [Rhodobacter sp.]